VLGQDAYHRRIIDGAVARVGRQEDLLFDAEVPAALGPPEVEELLPGFAGGRGGCTPQPKCGGQALVMIA
jgi:hypothetical protein